MSKKVSIVIVNFNTCELLKNCILSIKKNIKDIDYEIIVVDNKSIDDSIFMLEQEFKDIILIKSSKNLGFGKANNKGIDYANGDYIFLLNSDTLIINNVLEIFYKFMEEHKNVGICGGTLYTKDLKPNMPLYIYPTFLTEILEIPIQFLLYVIKIYLGKNIVNKIPKKPKEVSWLSGADMFIRKEVFEKCGKFDSDFFLYFEETELLNRVKKKFKLYLVPEAKIIHLDGGSFKFKKEREIYFQTSRYIFFKKMYGRQSLKYLYYITKLNNTIKYTIANIFNLGNIQNLKEKQQINKQIYEMWKK